MAIQLLFEVEDSTGSVDTLTYTLLSKEHEFCHAG
jgi:hypothetical protein